MTRARPRRTCCAVRWPPCPRRRGLRAGWRCAPTPGTSPGNWPAPLTTCTSASAIGAKRIASRWWRLLADIAEDDWHDAIGMDNAQVAVAEYCPDWWPANTALLVRRVLLDPARVSADPRSRRRRTLHPDQRDMLFPELARQPAVYAYSFHPDQPGRVSSPDKAAAVEHWYRHRTTVENIFRDSKLGACSAPALRLPAGEPGLDVGGAGSPRPWAARLHQLTAITAGEDILGVYGVRGGKAMIATLRWRLIAVPARLIRHARHLVLRLPPGHYPASRGSRPAAATTSTGLTCVRTLSPGSPSLPTADPAPIRRNPTHPANPAPTRAVSMPTTRNPGP